MTGNDVKNIIRQYIIENSELNGIEVYKDKHPPVTEENNRECIVVNVITLNNASWREGFANVNWHVPALSDAGYSEPNGSRMTDVEKELDRIFKKSILRKKDGETILIHLEHLQQEEDKETYSYFINARLNLTITNFKN